MSLPPPPPIQTYFVPVREDDLVRPGDDERGDFELVTAGSDLDDRADEKPVVSLISVAVAADNTVVWYDHWEDGYEDDLSSVTPASTTEVWGDGIFENGFAPGTTNDILEAGDTFVLESRVAVDRTTDDLLTDASDVISASFPIAVTRAAYPTAPGARLAGAVEVFSTDQLGATFEVPFGVDVISDTDAFDHTAVHVMAVVDGTSLFLKRGSTITPVPDVLDAGETAVIPDARSGDEIFTYDPSKASDGPPVQVNLITGEAPSGYEMRWYALQPVDRWSNDYYTPVFTGDGTGNNANTGPTQVWLYNPADEDPDAPDADDITINFQFGSGTADSVTLDGGEARLSPILEDDSGAHFFTPGGEPFFAVTQTDTTGNGAKNDWGHPLIPAEHLTSQAVIGLGYGNTDKTRPGVDDPFDKSGVRAWVSPVEDATVYVDFDGDGSPDLVRDVDALESIRLADNEDFLEDEYGEDAIVGTVEDDDDLGGTAIWATTRKGAVLPVDIAVAYGQDAVTNYPERQLLDWGTVVPPLPELEAGKSVSLADDADGDGAISPGDTVTFTIRVLNSGRIDVAAGGYDVVDFMQPAFDDVLGDGRGPLVYKALSTEVDYGEGAVRVGDGSADGTPFPLDEGLASGDVIRPGEIHVYTFDAVVKPFAELLPGTTGFTNEGELSNSTEGFLDGFQVSRPLAFESAVSIETLTNGEDADSPTGPELAEGATVTWTYEVTNTGETFLSNVVVVDEKIGTVPGAFTGDDLLEPGETWTFTASGTAVAGQYATTGRVTATAVYRDGTTAVPESVGGGTVEASDPTHHVGVAGVPSLAFEKAVVSVDGVAGGFIDEAGDAVVYRFVVENDGTVDLTDVVLADPLLFDGPIEIGDLAVGERWEREWTYTARQADIDSNGTAEPDDRDAGFLDNEATVSSDETGDVVGTATVAIDRRPDLSVTKTANVASVDEVGDEIVYTIEVTNTGNTTLKDVRVEDPLLEVDDFVIDRLTPGETKSGSATYEVTAADIASNGTVEPNDRKEGILENLVIADNGDTGPREARAEVKIDVPVVFCSDIGPFDRPGRREATEIGTGRDDALNGTRRDDVLFGRGGNDALNGNGGENVMLGHGGRDVINGGNRSDLAFGMGGRDTLNGNNGDDSLDGGGGHDNIYGAGGADLIRAGSGNDLVEAGGGDDRVNLGPGNDTVQGEGGDDCIAGGRDKGRIVGNDKRGYEVRKLGDELFGNGGSDTFEYTKGDGVDLIFDFKSRSGDVVRIRDHDIDDAAFVTAMTPYGAFGGILFENDRGRKEGIFFQQADDGDEVAAWADDGLILFV